MSELLKFEEDKVMEIFQVVITKGNRNSVVCCDSLYAASLVFENHLNAGRTVKLSLQRCQLNDEGIFVPVEELAGISITCG